MFKILTLSKKCRILEAKSHYNIEW